MSTPHALSFADKLAYASGGMSFVVKDVVFINFVLFYYVTVVGVSGWQAGLVLFVAMVWDAVTDPVVGSYSDNLRSRWGRRHPFMALGGVPLGLCLFALLAVPQEFSQGAALAWMLLWCLLTRTFLTVFTVPYLALGAELSTDYAERSFIAGVRTLFGWITGILLTALAWGWIFASDGELDGRLLRSNYLVLGVVGFILVATFTTLSTFGTAKHIPHLPRGEDNPSPGLRAMFDDLVEALGNANFRNLFGVMLTLGAATGLTNALSTHVNTYFWEFTTDELAGLTFAALLPIGFMMIFMGALNQRIEKQVALKICIIGLVLNTLWFVPGRLLGVLPENGDSLLLLCFLVNGFFTVVFVIWFQTVSASMIADISDEQEATTSRRQEGIFFAAQGFSIKFVAGAGAFLGGLVIDFVGLPVGAEPGSVDADVLFNLGLAAGPLVALLLLLPYFFARRLDLSQASHAHIRRQLESRRPTAVQDGS